MIFICRYGITMLPELVPDIVDYYKILVALLVAIAASTPAYLLGFIMLDERDENIHLLFKTLPLPSNYLLKCRSGFMMSLSFVFSILIITFNGLVHFGLLKTVALSVLFSFIPPILTFTIVSFSKNKIEAVAMFKGLNIFLVLPAAGFFVPGIWKFAFGVIPFFWTFDAFFSEGISLLFWILSAVSLLIHFLFIFLFYQIYNRRGV